MTNEIKELFEKHEVRKTRKQKGAFIEHILGYAEKHGYKAHVEGGSLRSRNIVIGDPESAKVTYTAHYDTCPRLPFPNFITPKNIGIYLLYQLVLTVVLVAIPMLIGGFAGYLFGLTALDELVVGELTFLVSYIILIGELALIMVGPANKHTANDNTSGVATLIEIMKELPEEQRSEVAFIFFDLEEVGLVGSSSYYAKHKTKLANKLIVNFDCVSDGKNILFVMKKGVFPFENALKKAYSPEGEYAPEFLSRGVFYPSDQAKFPCGVGACALKKSKRFGILYMNRIHTKRDTEFDEENIAFFKQGSIRLASELCGNKLDL